MVDTATATTAVHDDKCRSCSTEATVGVRVAPCDCWFCNDCYIHFLAETRLEPILQCRSCGLVVTSHTIVGSDIEEKQFDYTQQQAAVHGDEAGAAAASPAPQGSASKKKRALVSDSAGGKKKKRKTDDEPRKNKSFDEHLQDLTCFKETHGHWKVPPKEYKTLARFVYDVRTGRRKLTDGQRAKLDAIHFPWQAPPKKPKPDPKKRYKVRKSFDERMQDLRAYKELHGDCLVPYRYPNDFSLGEWVKDIRRGHVKISKEQRKELNSLGFNWETKTNKQDREWNEKLDHVKRYQKQYGRHDRGVPFEYDKQLREWCDTQRKLNKKNQLRDDRKRALDDIGFSWGSSGTRGVVLSTAAAATTTTFPTTTNETINHVEHEQHQAVPYSPPQYHHRYSVPL